MSQTSFSSFCGKNILLLLCLLHFLVVFFSEVVACLVSLTCVLLRFDRICVFVKVCCFSKYCQRSLLGTRFTWETLISWHLYIVTNFLASCWTVTHFWQVSRCTPQLSCILELLDLFSKMLRIFITKAPKCHAFLL